MKPIDLIYSRVSKENEKLQDIIIQETKIIEKYKLDKPIVLQPDEQIKDKINKGKPIVLRERGSAYKIEKFKKRKEFIKIINFLFYARTTTISDIFLGNYEKKPVNIYVWDSHRLMRNMEFSLFLLLLSDFFNISIYTFKDGKLKENEEETPTKKLLRYMVFAIHSYSGEEYSYTTSENIKKAFVKKGTATYSRDGLKVGKNFTRVNGEKVNFPYIKLKKLNERIISLHSYHKSKGLPWYYDLIIEKIKREFNIIISKSYISRLKRK